MLGNETAAGLVAMLSAITVEEGCTIFEHTAEEIGLEVMGNHATILASLRSTQASPQTVASGDEQLATVGEVERCARIAESDLYGVHKSCGMTVAAALRASPPPTGIWIDEAGDINRETYEALSQHTKPTAVREALESMTWVAQHSPNCPSPYLVRLPRGVIDMKSYAETGDAYGFGQTLDEAFQAALRTGEPK